MHADHIVPLRIGGIHDGKNFQPLCDVCNEKKNASLDPKLSAEKTKTLVCERYKKTFMMVDSTVDIERKLKTAVERYIHDLAESGQYAERIAKKKKEVNGQWNAVRVERKGRAWIERYMRYRRTTGQRP